MDIRPIRITLAQPLVEKPTGNPNKSPGNAKNAITFERMLEGYITKRTSRSAAHAIALASGSGSNFPVFALTVVGTIP
jgi:hypothetical protein